MSGLWLKNWNVRRVKTVRLGNSPHPLLACGPHIGKALGASELFSVRRGAVEIATGHEGSRERSKALDLERGRPPTNPACPLSPSV